MLLRRDLFRERVLRFRRTQWHRFHGRTSAYSAETGSDPNCTSDTDDNSRNEFAYRNERAQFRQNQTKICAPVPARPEATSAAADVR